MEVRAAAAATTAALGSSGLERMRSEMPAPDTDSHSLGCDIAVLETVDSQIHRNSVGVCSPHAACSDLVLHRTHLWLAYETTISSA